MSNPIPTRKLFPMVESILQVLLLVKTMSWSLRGVFSLSVSSDGGHKNLLAGLARGVLVCDFSYLRSRMVATLDTRSAEVLDTLGWAHYNERAQAEGGRPAQVREPSPASPVIRLRYAAPAESANSCPSMKTGRSGMPSELSGVEIADCGLLRDAPLPARKLEMKRRLTHNATAREDFHQRIQRNP